MKGTEIPTSDPQLESEIHSVEAALRTISENNPKKLLDLSGFISELDQNPDIQHLPVYIIFKQANSLIQQAGGEVLGSYVGEIQGKLKNEIGGEGLSCLLNLQESFSDDEKRVAVQKGILTIFLFRLAIEELYIPRNIPVTGPLETLLDFIRPPQ